MVTARLVLLLGLLRISLGCSAWPDPKPDPPQRSPALPTAVVILDPDTPLEEARAVTRFVVTPPADWGATSAGFWLFAGELSAYYAARLERSEIPDALLERQVPTLAWVTGPSIVVAPTTPLNPTERYSLALLGYGLVASIRVAEDARSACPRIWPPARAASGGAYAVYCAQDGPIPGRVDASLEPGPWRALAEPGVDGRGTAQDRCLRLLALDPLPPDFTLLPPPRVGDTPLYPEPLGTTMAGAVVPLECTAPEIGFGPGCATVQDDRLMLRVPADPLLWTLSGAGDPRVATSLVGGSMTITGLEPESQIDLTVITLDLGSRMTEDFVTVRTEPPRSHVVINEVLANPVGAEPAAEWVEIYNDGSAAVDLAGFRLYDSGGETVLMGGTLGARGFALLVREDYASGSAADPAPAAGTLLLRVSELGKNGLNNQGEPLRLEAPDGTVVSRFPSIPQPRPGISAVRREPAAADDDPTAFGLDPQDGSTPGAPNSTG